MVKNEVLSFIDTYFHVFLTTTYNLLFFEEVQLFILLPGPLFSRYGIRMTRLSFIKIQCQCIASSHSMLYQYASLRTYCLTSWYGRKGHSRYSRCNLKTSRSLHPNKYTDTPPEMFLTARLLYLFLLPTLI